MLMRERVYDPRMPALTIRIYEVIISSGGWKTNHIPFKRPFKGEFS